MNLVETKASNSMKAFEIVWDRMPECRGFYAAPTAGKAKYHVALMVVDCGYCHKTGDVFKGLKCKRRKDLDVWASQFDRIIGRSSEYVVEEIARRDAT